MIVPLLIPHHGHIHGDERVGRCVGLRVTVAEISPVRGAHSAKVEAQVLAGCRHSSAIGDISCDVGRKVPFVPARRPDTTIWAILVGFVTKNLVIRWLFTGRGGMGPASGMVYFSQ